MVQPRRKSFLVLEQPPEKGPLLVLPWDPSDTVSMQYQRSLVRIIPTVGSSDPILTKKEDETLAAVSHRLTCRTKVFKEGFRRSPAVMSLIEFIVANEHASLIKATVE